MADTPKPAPRESKQTSGGNPQAIAQVAVDLHIARRNFLIYPATHEQVRRSLIRAYDRLCEVLSQQPDIKIVVLKEGLFVDKNALPAAISVFKDLAMVLKQYQIASLAFTNGLKKDELVQFLELIVTDRATIQNQGGFDVAVTQAGLTHIHVQTVDYSKLQVTEEDQIYRSADGERSETSIWQQFIDRLPAKVRYRGDGGNASGQNADYPEELARMLNENIMDVGAAIEQYGAVFSADSTANAQSEYMSEGLPHFQQMIKALDPVLQKQFLAVTFDKCGQLATMADTAHLVDGLGGDLIVQMLKQASDQGKAISPSLLAFIKKMAHFEAPALMPTAAEGNDTTGEELGSEEVGTLLAHERFDQYVDQGYGDLLKKLTAQSQKPISAAPGSNIQSKLDKSLDEGQINCHVGRAMMMLMYKSPDIDSYRQWARQLTYLLDDLLESHAFHFLIDTLNFVNKEKKSNDSQKAKIARLVLDSFSDPQFVARAVEIIRAFGDRPPREVMDFLSALGEPVVVEIFEGLDPNETFYASDGFEVKLLDNLAAFTAREALARLSDPRPDYVNRMIRIIRRMGDSQSAEQVRPLLQHADLDIRLEALSTLLKFQNKWGLIHLRDIINDPNTPEFYKAIELAGRYKVLDLLPLLIAYAERGGGDRARQEAALRALGNIGDASVVPTLSKLVRRRWSLSKKNKHHIKRVVFDTLSGYPIEAVKSLIHFGLKQKDATIKFSCEQVLRKQLKP